MKLVILSSRFPYPIEKGDKLRLYHQMKGLAESHQVHLVSLHESKIEEEHLREIKDVCASVSLFNLPRAGIPFRTAKGLLNSKPFQVNYFYSKKIARKIKDTITKIQPDVVYCQLLRMSEYTSDLDLPKVLDYMDCFSMNYEKRQEFESFPKNVFFRSEASRLKTYEESMSKKFDELTIISTRDKDQVMSDKEISVISNGIDTAFFQPKESAKDTDLLFVGNMGYHPNMLAAKYLVGEIVPLINANVKVKIAGARPSSVVKNLAGENVTITGWIEDIREAYATSQLFVAPIFSGAGQQNKILEAMAMGMICITTPTVNDAIGAQDGKHLFIARNKQEFADKIEMLLNNIDLYQKIKKEARTFVKEHFSWKTENKKLNDIIVKARNNYNER